ncbi:Lipoprotein [Prescottella defluvii]|uniref:hypothetical protein n=1 Tax=Prescottella defluvii TaxID=1323361 RepID=UPI001E558A8F|nr:hypothetical protein [Prescottella defluvii]
MNGRNGRSAPRWCALACAALLGAGVVGVLATTHDTTVTTPAFPQLPQTTTEDTGLQQTNSFGYIPEHETTLPTNGNGPGAPGPIGDNPFHNPGPPIPGGPGLPAHATVTPTLTSPAG